MKTWKTLAVTGLLITGSMLGAESAANASVPASFVPSPADVAKYCNVHGTAIPYGQPVVSATTAPEECYNTFADSIRAATGGRVALPTDAKTVTAAQLASVGPTAATASVVLGTEYQDINFGGGAVNYLGSVGCGSGYFFSFNLSGAWNNAIGSARSYSNCKSGHFENLNNTGSVRICGCSSMGVMDDQTSSLRFSLSGL